MAMITVRDPLAPLFFTLKPIAHPDFPTQPGISKALKVFISLNTYRKPNADQCDKSFFGVRTYLMSND